MVSSFVKEVWFYITYFVDSPRVWFELLQTCKMVNRVCSYLNVQKRYLFEFVYIQLPAVLRGDGPIVDAIHVRNRAEAEKELNRKLKLSDSSDRGHIGKNQFTSFHCTMII
jgi:hypothetical protein